MPRAVFVKQKKLAAFIISLLSISLIVFVFLFSSNTAERNSDGHSDMK